MMRRTLLHSFATLLFSLSLWSAAVMAAVTTQVTVVTNVAGALVTETTIWDPATAAAAATTTAQTGFFTTVFTTTNDVGTTVTLTQTVNRATMLPTTTTSTSSTGKTTTTVPTATSSLSSGLYLSTVTTTNDLGTTVTLTQTFTHSSTSATSSASSSVSSSVSSSGSSSSVKMTTSTGSAVAETGTRPDPSTDFTEPPLSAVTSLSIDSYITITEGTTSTYTTARAPTSMWVTVVRQGNTITVQTTFVQRFSSQYVTVASPSVGSIGMGTLTGTVGVIKSAIKKTVSHNEAQHLGMSSLSSILGGLLTVLIWFL
ncbi:CEI_1a_G0043520.mRNA.1.CDS.1 [Saccharomyces cerevisiae]|nr:EM14S01-3B_G0009140.mRNA.1.CDS.1 [Saccharomyces cerevisiae]CAI4715701.1 CEI_1a_G0043520.mRNA.1.CDS.1 [Saccharomyces cerevisiae]CAI4716184.1 AMH_1a_G0043620.mRNA.1.CDS.1 [Saccharomyces cerevisiae]CAI6850732.1 AMH_1a_G0043620.mRNA.1.CDS.1 [Saccharomyces cerevisiae]CAI7436177.1 CEI_1a_G0043520.mRNA.1.CDS.1 [Saccharomyces cerevisiae]